MNQHDAFQLQPCEATVAAPAAEIIPLAAHESFYKLKDVEQQRVSLLLKLFEEIDHAEEGVVRACARIALENTEKGFSFGNLKTLYYAWRNSKRDWRVLVRRYAGSTALPVEFVEEVRRRAEQNKRGTRQALLTMKDEWKAGASIPGYGTWREHYLIEYPERAVPAQWPMGFFPKGWSQSNLYTKQSSKAERMLARRGVAAAKRYLPHVIRDTSDLRFLELIAIDDFEIDVLVLARHPITGKYEITTCTGLLAIDVATRTIVGFGLKPRFKGEEGQRIAITRGDVQGLLHSVFTEHGLPVGYGVTILAENAAAAISGDFELALETLLGVQVARTGLLHDKTLRNGFVQGGGKPWEKGWIESTFNLMHNMAGALAGQKGASYQLKPADLEAKILFAEKLIAIEGLAPEVIAQLRVPFLPFEQALEGYTRIFRAMERRTAHKMEGFGEIVQYQLPDGSDTVSAEALVTLDRDQVLACTPVPRKESPLERKARVTAGVQFSKIPDGLLALLLLTPKKVTLRNHAIAFAHGAKSYTFSNADSPVLALPEGTELLGYFDGTNSSTLHCTHLDGRYVGPVKRRGAVSIRDREAIAAECGEVSRIITKHVLNPVRARHETENAQLAADDAHNLKLLRAAGIAEADIPARLLPPAKQAAPAHNAPASADTNTATPAPAAKSLTQKLARRPMTAGDCIAAEAKRQALAQGIAEVTGPANAERSTAAILRNSDEIDGSIL